MARNEGNSDEYNTASHVPNPSQIIRRLTFLTTSLTTCLIQKFVQNIISFVVAWFINKGSSRMT